jgi:predicted component of type VI protein secretion system
MEHEIDQRRVLLGCGPGVDLSLDDPSLEREHAALEFGQGGYRLRNLSRRGRTCLNGGSIDLAELKPGDRFSLGDLLFAFSLDPR